MKNLLKIFFLLGIMSGLVGCNFGKDEITIRTIKKDVTLKVEVVKESREIEKGLSGRERLEENEGMLFVFPVTLKQRFWMKEMNFSLDIIFIGKDGLIGKVLKNVVPCEKEESCPFYSSEIEVNKVLEVNAGWLDRNEVGIGDKVVSE